MIHRKLVCSRLAASGERAPLPNYLIQKVICTEHLVEYKSNIMALMPVTVEKQNASIRKQLSSYYNSLINELKIFIVRPDIAILFFFKCRIK
ncbi:hypothetical protein BSY18_4175 (plasmid) [Blastomonas sp. RAC04]|nr:hypothetical protein BSY18_4175 [Blastomonas sp. RAC04]